MERGMRYTHAGAVSDLSHSVAHKTRSATRYLHKLIAEEVSSLTRYCTGVLQFSARRSAPSKLLDMVDCPSKKIIEDCDEIEQAHGLSDRRRIVLLDGTLNHQCDAQGILTRMHARLGRGDRLVIIAYNPYIRPLYQLQKFLGMRDEPVPDSFFTYSDLYNLARLSNFEMVRWRPIGFVPWRLFGLGSMINRLVSVIPLVRKMSLTSMMIFRPLQKVVDPPSASIIIPARNERGNIENALLRMPTFPAPIEIIFVEGHSKDDTWAEIQRIKKVYTEQGFTISAYQQTGKGKADAVRLGFSKAKHDLLMILDADLTTPPDYLLRYYEAFCQNHGDFINGTRLVYPMEGQAMRPLNKIGNKFFAKALSVLLDCQLTDSLCGTKVVTRHDYNRMVAWRRDFGDFDPFGDFELLFPAATLGLGILDIPVKYKDREYGSTQISRFRHGFMLFKMVVVGFLRIKVAKG